jgi:hypothetical protein
VVDLRNARELPSVNAQHWVVKQLETLDRGIQRVRALAEDVHENVFYGVLDAHKVSRSTRSHPSKS